MKMDTPTFETWSRETVDKFAHESYQHMQRLTDACEQLRADLKDAMALVRMLREKIPHE